MRRKRTDSLPRYLLEERGHQTPCWIWQGNLNPKGYGTTRSGKPPLAHRAVWMEHGHSVPSGMELDHLCRVRSCVNPDHLEAVTHKENMRRGYAVVRRHASPGLPSWIRSARLAAQLSQADQAAALGCSQALVAMWERGRLDVSARWVQELGRVFKRPLPDPEHPSDVPSDGFEQPPLDESGTPWEGS